MRRKERDGTGRTGHGGLGCDGKERDGMGQGRLGWGGKERDVTGQSV